MQQVATFRIGETSSLALSAVTGDPTTVGAIRAALKKMPPDGALPATSAAEDALFSTSYAADTGNGQPGFILSLSSAQTAALKPGMYALDARLSVAGGTIITSPALVKVVAPVTGPGA